MLAIFPVKLIAYAAFQAVTRTVLQKFRWLSFCESGQFLAQVGRLRQMHILVALPARCRIKPFLLHLRVKVPSEMLDFFGMGESGKIIDLSNELIQIHAPKIP